MSQLPTKPRGLYFEEFQPGQEIVTAGRTLTEADVVNFAGISGDFNQIHVDAQYSSQTVIGQRIVHGLLVASVASGLAVQTGVLEGTVIVFREIAEWKFIKPVFLGDTIHGVLRVKETKDLRRTGGGLVTIEFEVLNQSDEVVNRGIWIVLVAVRPL
jgi:3-hydroxybutyryl-CoA dehydratase